MAVTGSRRGAANTTSLVLATVAVAAIGGLIYWLSVTAEPTQTTLEPIEQEEEPASDVPIVDLGSIREETEGYIGFEVEVRNQNVTSTLGQQAFWIGSQDNPFLVKKDSAVLADTTLTLANGDVVHARGYIREMSDSVLDAWEAAGAIAGAGERAVASFAEVFLEASRVRKVEPESGGSGSGSDAAGDGDAGAQAADGAGDGGGR